MLADLTAEADSLVAFLLTYGMHSTLLLGAAWLWTTWSAVRSAAFREAAWKLALVGPMLTSIVATVSVQEPWGGQIELVQQGEREPSSPEQFALSNEQAKSPLVASNEIASSPPDLSVAASNRTRPHGPGEFEPPKDAPAVAATGESFRWDILALSIWLFGVVWSGRRMLMGTLSLEKVLRGCSEISDGPMRACLDATLNRTGIRRPVQLFVSSGLTAPIAVGVLRWRIGVPERAVAELAAEEQESLLAHELAHLVRRDCLWLWAVRIVETVFFFQPLNRLAAKRLRVESEYQCDLWVVEQTGDGMPLARCLASVAQWVTPSSDSLPAASMAGNGSTFARRIEALLREPSSRRRRSKPFFRHTLMAVGGALIVLLGLAGPRAVVRSASLPEFRMLPDALVESPSSVDHDDLLPGAENQLELEPSSSLSAHLMQAAGELNDLETELRDLAPILLEADFDEVRVRLLRIRLARLKAHRRRLEAMAASLFPREPAVAKGAFDAVIPRIENPYPFAPSLQGEQP